MLTEIRGGRVLTEDGALQDCSVFFDRSAIRILGPAGSAAADRILDASGLLVLPGIVDLHGDAFERQLMPRPGVHFDHGLALLDTDRQLVANGITTAFHGLTLSWEPGLRGDEAAEDFMTALQRARPMLACDTRLHLRFETFHLDAVVRVASWIEAGRVDLLAFNDHVDMIAAKIRKGSSLTTYLGRTGLSAQEFTDLLARVRSRRDAVPKAVRHLAAAARAGAVPMASHDDETPEMRQWYRTLGCRLCEFPVDVATARAAREHGDAIILGAPNIVRGGSHAERLSAREAVALGLCDVLTSDYYYPSLLQAAFALVRDGAAPLGAAWGLVSSGPALAAGLGDRGVLAAGWRADIVLVEDGRSQRPDGAGAALPTVAGTIAGGKIAWAADRILPALQ
ncbi:alpha-D-ribose 1-methylphosphonate 5-triphosphate diphosphatase [Arenibaculum pallidiluteum]|uniref:alpha-D-ribose 1-methylphosphonate 5-triphosphate diphosphatase n=1 Tax=Arenibaculum pallidiluteum TaxID=2812559 RepID=UPI001A958F00|nr:alpha-D-ribose 1-methylphosphonate 5-triphosphate diphosphatase [Arenibaculum pallidiluteum]